MAPMRGNKNKNIIRDLGPKAPEEIGVVPEETQTSKDAKIEALRKERDAHSIGQFGLGPGPGPNRERRSDLGFDCNPFPNTHHRDPFQYDREPRRLYGFDRQPHHLDREPYQPHGLHREPHHQLGFDRAPRHQYHRVERPRASNRDPHRFVDVDREPRQGSDRSIHDQDRNNNNRNREPLVLDRAPQDLDRTPRDLDRAPPGFDRASPAFDHAPGFERAPPCVNLAQLGFDRAHSGYDLAPPPFDQEFPQTRVGHDCLAPPPFDREHHQRDQMEGDYGGDWGFHQPHGVDRGFDREPRHLQGLDHGVDREPRRGHGFNRAPPPQQAHVFFACHGVDSPVLNREHCTADPRWDTSQCWDYVDEIEEIIIQPPVYDIEVEDEIEGDQEVKDMTLILEEILPAPKDGMLIDEHVSSQFVNCYQQVPKEEIEERKRLENNISHSTCRSEDKVFELLIDEECCSLHKKEHHYTLRPKKDTTKSKPMVKMKIIGFPNCWSRQQLITEYCIQGHVSIDKALVLLQEINAEYKARVDQYAHGDVSIA
uniref:Uncharacterized protein n=1 Tax=Fagus sylvatica TaxID=28930 RepID=A0A2N9GJ85_FAGSY